MGHGGSGEQDTIWPSGQEQRGGLLDPVPASGVQLGFGLFHSVPHPRGQERLERRGASGGVHPGIYWGSQGWVSRVGGIWGFEGAYQPDHSIGQPVTGETPTEGERMPSEKFRECVQVERSCSSSWGSPIFTIVSYGTTARWLPRCPSSPPLYRPSAGPLWPKLPSVSWKACSCWHQSLCTLIPARSLWGRWTPQMRELGPSCLNGVQRTRSSIGAHSTVAGFPRLKETMTWGTRRSWLCFGLSKSGGTG